MLQKPLIYPQHLRRSIRRDDVLMENLGKTEITVLDYATLHRGYANSHCTPTPLFLSSAFQPSGE